MNDMQSPSELPEISVVVPVYNEGQILDTAIPEFLAALSKLGRRFELILCENGSHDQTLEILDRWSQNTKELRYLSIDRPNYGAALREGIFAARGDIVICEEIDIGAASFWREALRRMDHDNLDLVIGSKAMVGAHDRRPWIRRCATRMYNQLLRWILGFRGTDTHGLKVLRRKTLLSLVDACIVEHDVFASELVIRAQRARLLWREIPVSIEEKRAPSIALHRRVPKVLRQILRLSLAIHAGIGESQPARARHRRVGGLLQRPSTESSEIERASTKRPSP